MLFVVDDPDQAARTRRRPGGGPPAGYPADMTELSEAEAGRGAAFGVYLPQVSLTFEQILEQAQRTERLGLGSFWIYDHLYTPMVPDRSALEGWTLATALLARTATLRVGHLVLNNNLRHPALLAKMIATADVISGGRLDVGIGSGSYALEHDQAGMAFGTLGERSSRLAESLAIIDGMLTNPVFSYTGDHFTVQDLPSLPGPAQQPRPPLHIGGINERFTLPLVARYADVWNVPTYGLDDWPQTAAALDRACTAIGRDPADITRSHQAVLVLAADDRRLATAVEGAGKHFAGPGWNVDAGGYVGTPAAVVDHIAAMQARGIERFIFLPSDRGRGEMLDLLATDVIPHLT